MSRSRITRLFLLCTVLFSAQTAGAAPQVLRYQFATGNTPFRSSGGLLGDSGNYDLVGGFSVTLDQEQGTAILHDIVATLVGVPDDFDLNGVDLMSALGLYAEPVTGAFANDGSLQFEQCNAGTGPAALACSAAEETTPVSGPVQTVYGDPTYPFARKTILTMNLENGLDEISLTASTSSIHFVLDAGVSHLTRARATLVPEPAAIVSVLLATICLLGKREL